MGQVLEIVKWTYVYNGVRDLDQTRLSKNFVASEFACKCRRGECNTILVDTMLVFGCQSLRNLMNEPIEITSGHRCADHNAEIGGSPKSMHMLGKAADLRTRSRLNMNDLLDAAERLPYLGGLGIYMNKVGQIDRLHIDFRENKDGSLVKWTKNV